MLISQVLASKGGEVATVGPDSSIADVVASLAEHGIGALVVSSDAKSIDGIISERDIVRALNADGTGVLSKVASDLMTKSVVTCGVDATTEQLMEEMSARRFRHMPVVEQGALVGIVSIGDVVNARLRELETERQQLTDYISGH